MAFREQVLPWILYGLNADKPSAPLHLGYLYFTTDSAPTASAGFVALPLSGGITGATGTWVPFTNNSASIQRGHATLVNGSVTVPATIGAASVIEVTRRNPLGVAHGTGVLQVTLPAYGNTAVSFDVKSLDAAGSLVVADVDGFDWTVTG